MDARERDDGKLVYRLEIEGRVGPRWTGWFDADSVRTRGDRTVLEVRVADQSELYGRLRRIHDLNLRLVAVRRVEADPAPGDRTQGGGDAPR